MKKLALSLSVFAAATFGILNTVTAQEAKTIEVENTNAPEITFEKTTHDYGTIENGANGVYEFKFTNTGKEPLIISRAKGSCGCTVPSWPSEPILPGESGTISVKYDTKRTGPINKSVTITSNASTPTAVLRIKGTVKAPVVEPTSPVKETTDGATPIVK
jgi:hypothetical protein